MSDANQRQWRFHLDDMMREPAAFRTLRYCLLR